MLLRKRLSYLNLMGKLSIDIERQLDVMIKYGLSAEEFFLTELLMLATEDPEHKTYLLTYFGKAKKEQLAMDTLQALKDKGVLDKECVIPQRGQTFTIGDIKLNLKFLDEYFKLTLQAGEELKNAYPDFLQFGDRLMPAKNIVTSGYRTEEDFFFAYAKKIRHSRKKHNEVLEILDWAKQQKLITYGMVEYVTTSKWKDHIRMREAGDLGGYTVRIETLEDL